MTVLSMSHVERSRAPWISLPSATIGFMGLCLVGALAGAILDRNSSFISEYFLVVQDGPVLFAIFVFLGALRFLVRGERRSVPADWLRHHPTYWFWATLCAAVLAILLGARLVTLNFPLSIDEFWATFDATVIARGHLVAAVARDWQAYVPSLQPMFRLEVPGNGYWISTYLPTNAAIRAVFIALGQPVLTGACLAAIAIAALFAIARRLWPERPDAAVVGVVLLATSSQFVITAMTPYAMTAHLALNLVWLWLFLRDTRISHGVAAGVAFIACGLHQVIFHPLFAAPFLLSLLFARRWKLAIYYGIAYAAIGAFWMSYWSLALWSVSPQLEQSADVGLAFWLHRIANLIDLSPHGLGLMALGFGLNLARFLAWQNPLTIPLALVGLFACRSWRSPLTQMAAGVALALVVLTVLMPFQAHGWGYRYLHGFLGSFALLAAQGWIWATDRAAETTARPAMAMTLSTLFAVLVLLPWHGYQVHAFTRPYASAAAAIERSSADVVIVDPRDIWYGVDLVRNDPFLRNSPKVLDLGTLSEPQLQELCRRYNVAVFDRRDAQQAGIRAVPSLPEVSERNQAHRAVLNSLNCGHAL